MGGGVDGGEVPAVLPVNIGGIKVHLKTYVQPLFVWAVKDRNDST